MSPILRSRSDRIAVLMGAVLIVLAAVALVTLTGGDGRSSVCDRLTALDPATSSANAFYNLAPKVDDTDHMATINAIGILLGDGDVAGAQRAYADALVENDC